MNQKTTLIAAVAVCSIAGFMVGRISSEPDAAASNTDGSATGAGRPGSPGFAGSRGPAGPRSENRRSSGFATANRQGGQSSAFEKDPIARMEAIINDPDPLNRAEAWLRFVKGLDASEIEDVVVSFRGKGLTRDNLSEYSMLLTAWANHDPIAALDYASENTGSPFARQTILTSWATKNPGAALEWAKANHEGEGANPWMVGVIRGIAATDPARATELMNAMPYSEERGDALSAVMGHYLKQGPEAARTWAMSIEDERLRAGAMARIADNLARVDPKGTADWLVANPGDASVRAMSEVMERMTDQDADAAVAYFNSINDENLKRSALAGVTDQLTEQNPQEALALIDANPTLVNDRVVTEFVWGARNSDTALGASMIARIQDEGDRNRTYRRYIGRWMHNDLEGALNWANQNELPETVQRQVQSMAERFQNQDR